MDDTPLLRSARVVLAHAARDLQQADRALSIAASVRWLAKRHIHVHPNTVRHWCDRGAVPHVKIGANRRAIPLSALEHIAACPLCTSRL